MLRLILLPILFLLPAIPALAATINVDSNCTLAQAVISAGNDSAPADSGCEDGDNDDTIQLSYYVRITATLPIVSSGDKITIDGGGYTVRGGGSGSDFRMLSVPSDVSVVLQNITIADFHVSASGNDSGGAIIVNGGIENNTVVIRNAVFRDNSATGRDSVGGAIWFSGGVDSILIEDSFFIDNHTIGSGGAIFLESSATINNTAFIGNSAQNGGAIHVNNDVELTLTNSSFINNEVPESNGTGGALRFFNNSGSTVESTLTHVTFSGNTGRLDRGPTIGASGNSTSNISIRNSIISSGCYVDGSASLSAVGSLATDAACLGAQTLDPADTLNRGDLGRYVAYSNYAGGYYLLSSDSAAIDKADATYCEERDQRNQSVFTRGSSNCDAGAIEYFISKPAESNSTDQKATAPKMPPPVAHTCQDLVAQGYGVWAAYGLTSGVQCQRRDHSAIGIQWVLDAGLLDAVDVWGYADQAVEICFPPERGRGGIYFIDSTVTPNAAIPWPSELRDGFICAAIDRAGTLTLVSSGAPMPIPTKPAPSAASLKNCMVTTDTIVNFRDGPDGDLIRFQDPNGDEIYGWLPANVTLTALDRTPGWFLVDYHGTQGWITVWRVTEAPSC